MKYDKQNAYAIAFAAVSEAARILNEAVENEQEFTVDYKAGETPDGKSFDGSFEIRIRRMAKK